MKTKQYETKRRRTQAVILLVLLNILAFSAGIIDEKSSIRVEPEESVIVRTPISPTSRISSESVVAGVSVDLAEAMAIEKKNLGTAGVSNAFLMTGENLSVEENEVDRVSSSFEDAEGKPEQSIFNTVIAKAEAEAREQQLRMKRMKENAKAEVQAKAESLLVEEYYTLKETEFIEICETEVSQIGKNFECVYKNMPEEFEQICKEAYSEAKEVVGDSFYYVMTEEEFEMECKLAKAEAGNQGLMGMVYVVNCSINYAKHNGITVLDDIFSEKPKRYSPEKNGKIYLGGKIEITDDMITDEVRKAVTMASRQDYTEEMLKEAALEKGITDPTYYEGGAMYFYAPKGIEDPAELKARENISLTFQHKGHVFYRIWD